MNLDRTPTYSKTPWGTKVEQGRHGYHDFAGDHDFYKVALVRGRTHRIALDRRRAASIRVVDRAGRVVLRLTQDVNGPSFIAVQFTAGYSGPFWLDLAGVSGYGSDEGCRDYDYSIRKLF